MTTAADELEVMGQCKAVPMAVGGLENVREQHGWRAWHPRFARNAGDAALD